MSLIDTNPLIFEWIAFVVFFVLLFVLLFALFCSFFKKSIATHIIALALQLFPADGCHRTPFDELQQADTPALLH